jgi:pyridoxal phosphate enzyme (YggS family)
MTTIADKLQQVQHRVAQACERAGRDPASVLLLAVSKTFGPDAVLEAARAGQHAFGENYLQEAVEKMAALRQMGAPTLQWHCIGPVQSNKTRLVAEHFDWMHTVDRLKVAQRLSDQRPAHLPPLQVCIQINVDGGAQQVGRDSAGGPGLGPKRGGLATVVPARADEHPGTGHGF